MQTGEVMRRLASPAVIPAGSTRLLARIDTSLPGMEITPGTDQKSAQTIVIAHLKHPPLPPAQVDVNLIGDFRDVLTDADESD